MSRAFLIRLLLSALLLTALGFAQLQKITIPAGTPEDKALQEISNEPDAEKKLAMYEDFVRNFSSNPMAVAYGNWQIAQYYQTSGDLEKSRALPYSWRSLSFFAACEAVPFPKTRANQSFSVFHQIVRQQVGLERQRVCPLGIALSEGGTRTIRIIVNLRHRLLLPRIQGAPGEPLKVLLSRGEQFHRMLALLVGFLRSQARHNLRRGRDCSTLAYHDLARRPGRRRLRGAFADPTPLRDLPGRRALCLLLRFLRCAIGRSLFRRRWLAFRGRSLRSRSGNRSR
jgi:hypothetical protein